MAMVEQSNRDLASVHGQRGVESVILARLIERHPSGSPDAEVVAEMTAEDNTPGLAAVVQEAIDGLLRVNLLVSADGVLHPTPAALRSGELELGL
jgi:hypothetical protein